MLALEWSKADKEQTNDHTHVDYSNKAVNQILKMDSNNQNRNQCAVLELCYLETASKQLRAWPPDAYHLQIPQDFHGDSRERSVVFLIKR